MKGSSGMNSGILGMGILYGMGVGIVKGVAMRECRKNSTVREG